MRTVHSSNTTVRAPWCPSLDQVPAVRLAYLACQSLIAEAELTPKPGLVDRRSAGAHTDLSLSIMKLSAFAIEPYFCEMAFVSGGSHPSQALREQLAVIGRDAERAMLKVTNGSNSHKGAIWILGLLVSAAAFELNDEVEVSQIAATAKEIASFADRATPRLVSHGDVVAKKYGVAGAPIRDYAKLGLLYKLLHVENPEKPSLQEIRKVQGELVAAVADARGGRVDLRNRLESTAARETRKASLLVRTKLEAQWLEK
jgi:triphosphoribosyl-dephospho-CoA synthetase